MDYDSDSVFPVNKTGRDSELRNMFRHGKVTEVLPPEQVKVLGPCVRVQYLDKDGLISKFLPVKQKGSRSTSDFYCPKVGDDVQVTMLPNGNEDGFVDGCFYNTGNPPPITDTNTRHITFADGTYVEYAEKASSGKGENSSNSVGTGTLTINSVGPITIKCVGPCYIETQGAATIKSPSITLDGPVHITKSLTVDGVTNLNSGGTASPHLTNADGSGNGS